MRLSVGAGCVRGPISSIREGARIEFGLNDIRVYKEYMSRPVYNTGRTLPVEFSSFVGICASHVLTIIVCDLPLTSEGGN